LLSHIREEAALAETVKAFIDRSFLGLADVVARQDLETNWTTVYTRVGQRGRKEGRAE
jgi:hypothetical protein